MISPELRASKELGNSAGRGWSNPMSPNTFYKSPTGLNEDPYLIQAHNQDLKMVESFDSGKRPIES